ncbi:Myb DNA-bind 3 domain-containing protein [Citrus sinensis]|nr:Myb DNA-bind 3 domain-containing protein [Citrus sinensis]
MDPHDVDVEDKADWSSRIENVFICIVHDHKIWTIISDELFEQSHKRFNVGQLKSKFNRLRKKHREFSDLVAHTGFGWDLVSNTVTASEAVWAEYIKRVPGVKLYRKKGLEHYQTLGEIFNTTTASGHLCFSSSQVPLSSDEERELEENFLGHGVHVDIEDDDLMEPLSETRTEKRPRRPIATERGKNNKSEFDNYFKMASLVMNARMEMVK